MAWTRHAPVYQERLYARTPPSPPVALLRMHIEETSVGVGVRECAEEFGADHERGTLVEATPIPFVPASCSATCEPGAGWIRPSSRLRADSDSPPVCSAVLSEEQYRPGTLSPGA